VEKTRRGQLDVDWNEPYRIAAAVRKFKLTYCVITSVTRDDLPDGGAILFVKTIQLIHEISRDIQIEVLVPDFQGNKPSIKKIIAVQPDTMGHNIETVRRLYEGFRPEADYDLSLEVLRTIKQLNPKMITKSSLMLGLGEEKDEVIETMIDLRDSGCDILTLGQYLAPSILHYPIKEFVTPQQFERYKKIGLQLGFKAVAAGPLVRSSYQAQEVFQEAKESKESWGCTI
jgi:lipoic acid synthetase